MREIYYVIISGFGSLGFRSLQRPHLAVLLEVTRKSISGVAREGTGITSPPQLDESPSGFILTIDS